MPMTRRTSIAAMVATMITGCGGGGSEDTSAGGSFDKKSITSQSNGQTYPLSLYIPPGSSADRASMPVVYVLDGESRFQVVLDIVRQSGSHAIVVAIGNEANRAIDYVPPNTCTPGGGGEIAFLNFIRLELTPTIEATVGGDPARRVLLGHSHGGSFVLYALFAQAPGTHHFSAYLASDASIACMSPTVYGWEATYHAQYTALPVRLHISYAANAENGPFAQLLASRQYVGLALAAQFYAGGHIGMIPAAFTDALRFASATS